MITAVVIEDEKHLAKALQSKLEHNGIEVLAHLSSVESAKKYFEKAKKIDLIFADIQLGDGLSFEIFHHQKMESVVIFTTAFDTYTLEAFQLNSIDYILKPITDEKLKHTLKKFESLKKSFQPDFEHLMQQFLEEKSYPKNFLVKVGNFYHSIHADAIHAIFSAHKITYIQTERTLVWEESLNHIEKQLNPKEFFRISRQFIVNRNAIQEIKTHLNSRLQLRISNIKEPVVVSRERVSDFKKWLSS